MRILGGLNVSDAHKLHCASNDCKRQVGRSIKKQVRKIATGGNKWGGERGAGDVCFRGQIMESFSDRGNRGIKKKGELGGIYDKKV